MKGRKTIPWRSWRTRRTVCYVHSGSPSSVFQDINGRRWLALASDKGRTWPTFVQPSTVHRVLRAHSVQYTEYSEYIVYGSERTLNFDFFGFF